MSACAALTVLGCASGALAVNDVNGSLLTFNTNGGWCWFQDPRVVVDQNQLLIGSIAGTTANGATAGDVRVTAYDLASQVASTVTLHSAIQTDDHDAATVTVLPDGRYLAMYQKHSSDSLARWRVSTGPGSIADWGPEQTGVANPAGDGDNNTYANPFYLSVPNRIYSFSRSVGWDPNYSVLSGLNPTDDSSLTFSYGGHLLYWVNPDNGVNGATGGAGRPYVKYASDGADRIWFVTTEDHPRNYYNSLYAGYIQFDANGVGTVHRSDGSIVAGSNGRISTAVTPNPAPSGNNALAIPSGTGYSYSPAAFTKVFSSTADGNAVASWANDVEIDSAGNPFTVFSIRRNDPADGYVPNDLDYYYARFDGASWDVHRMGYAGSTLYNGENDYAGLATLDPGNPGSVYISTNYTPDTDVALAHWEIYHGTTADGGATWSWSPVTADSTVDNLRPMLADVDSSRVALTWMRGTYSSYTNFNTSVVGLILPSTGPVSSLVAYWTGSASASRADAANDWGSTAPGGATNFSTDAAGTTSAARMPDSSTAVLFSAAGATPGPAGALSTRLDADYSIRSLTFDVPASTGISSAVVDTNGHALTLGAGGLAVSATSNSSAAITGTGPVLLAGSQIWVNVSSARALTVAAPVRAASAGATVLTLAGSGAAPIVIAGPIFDGAGTLSVANQSGVAVLSAANTYTGPTVVSGGTLRAADGVGLPAASNLTLGGGLFSPAAATFTRALGSGAGQVRLAGGASGFGADGAELTVTLGNGGVPIRWGSADFAPSPLTFNSAASTNDVTFTNDLDLNGGTARAVQVNAGVDTMSGVISDSGTTAAALQVGGAGTLVLSNPNNTYAGGTVLNPGAAGPAVVRAVASNALGTGVITTGPVGNGTTARLELAGGITLPNAVAFTGRNNDSVAIESVGGDNVLSGTLRISVGGTRYWVQSDAGTLTLSGAAGGGVAVTSVAGPPADGSRRTLTLKGGGDGLVSGVIQNGSATNGLAVDKDGAGTWILSAANTYTGPTIVDASNTGALVLTPAAWGPVLSNGGGAVVNGGRLVFDYTGTASPAAAVVPLLGSSHDASNFTSAGQRLRTTNANDPGRGLGYFDDGATSRLVIMYTWYGDADLDGKVTAEDYALLDRGFAEHLAGWSDGDFNYDGVVDANDYLLIDTAYLKQQGGTPSPAFVARRESQFGDAYVSALLTGVPEPSAIGCLAAGFVFLPRRRR